MQAYDENNKLISTEVIEQEQASTPPQSLRDQLAELLKSPTLQPATKIVINGLPNQGSTVEIGGLSFLVKYVNKKNGDVHLKLKYPEDEKSEDVT